MKALSQASKHQEGGGEERKRGQKENREQESTCFSASGKKEEVHRKQGQTSL